MSSRPKPFLAARQIRKPDPPRVELKDCQVIYERARNEQNRPILAGVQIACGTRDGTLGIVYIGATGGQRMITAAHLCRQVGDIIGQPDVNSAVASVMAIAPDYQNSEVDVLKANITLAPNNVDDNGVFGNLVTYWIDAYSNWTDENEQIQIEGAASGTSSGRVVIPNAIMSVQAGGQALVVALATYNSQAMDSGAPVIGFDGEEAIFYGIHGGRVLYQQVNYAWFVPYGAFADFLN